MKQNTMIVLGRKILGVILIVVGIAGLLLPALQGVAMIAAGVVLLGNDKLTAFCKRWWQWLKEKLGA